MRAETWIVTGFMAIAIATALGMAVEWLWVKHFKEILPPPTRDCERQGYKEFER